MVIDVKKRTNTTKRGRASKVCKLLPQELLLLVQTFFPINTGFQETKRDK